ncbi:MAG: hypothetical protein JXA58_03505 [Dehalococcoidia bacterium]|nr:hypothetical protein [Dehalococcoidia bacterium]
MSENIVAVIPQVRKPKSFGRSDTYTLVVTDVRLVFAELTSAMLKEITAEVQRKGKEEGKGFLSRWGDQIKASMNYAERYWRMTPDQALSENSGNFALPNTSVKKIKISSKDSSNGPDDTGRSYTELKIEASNGKLEFKCDGHARPIKEALTKVFGDLVR